MATLTTSYQLLAQTYVGNTGYADVYLRAYAKYNSQSIANNTSSVSYKSTIYFSTGTFYTGNTTTKSLAGNGATSVVQDGAATYYAGETTLNEITGTVTHNAEGKYTTGISATFVSTPWGWNATAQATADLPTIPRYATSNQSLNSKTETTIKMNWSSDNTIDYIWYSKNNGSTWTGIDVTDGKSGTYTISGLTANTTYTIKTRVRRKDSQLTTDSSALSVTTYKVPTNALNSREETTVKINWSVDSTADYIWYSKDNGSNWTAVGSVSATSGTYTISGLSANTTYNIKTRVRRKATQSTYDTASVSVTTYNYPHITAVGTTNLIIGNSQKLTLYNPLSRTVTIKMYQNSTSGTQLYSGTTSSTTITFTPTASTLYATIPSAKSGKCVYSAIYSSSTKTTSGAYTYVINESTSKPTFTNFAYADIDPTTKSVTNNNQILVNGHSDCYFTVPLANKAVAKNSATMVSYKYEWGSLSKTGPYSSDDIANIALYESTGGTLKVTAIDSRGLSTTVTKTVPYIAYTNAVVNSVEVQRLNGVDLETYLGLKMTIWKGNWQNGSDTAYDNQLKYVGYRVYDGSAWTSYFDITDTVKSNMSSSTSGSSIVITVPLSKKMAIHANGSSGGFTIGKSYTIQVLIKDGTSTATFTPYSYQATAQGTVPDGKVGFSRYKDSDGNYHYAINGMPEKDSALYVHGNVRTAGDILIPIERATRDTTVPVSGGIDNKDGSITTLRELNKYKTLLGTVYLNNTWYDVISIRHRNGNGDGQHYGMLMYTKLTSSGDLYWLKQLNSTTWQDVRTILDSANYSTYALPKTGGTLTGDLLIKQGTSDEPYVRLDNGSYKMDLIISGSDRGIYDRTNGKWLLYLNSSNNAFFKGLADNADHLQNILTNPTTGTWYYIPVFSGIGTADGSAKNAGRTNDGFRHWLLQGTASATGRSQLALGNNIATGTAGNKRGELRIFSEKTGCTRLHAVASQTGDYTVYLPEHNGYLHGGTTLYNNTSGTTGTVTLSESAANFTNLEIYYAKSGNAYNSTKIPSPNGKNVNLTLNEYVGGQSIMQTLAKNMKISTTSITVVSNSYGYGNVASAGASGAAAENQIYIYKVVGYR